MSTSSSSSGSSPPKALPRLPPTPSPSPSLVSSPSKSASPLSSLSLSSSSTSEKSDVSSPPQQPQQPQPQQAPKQHKSQYHEATWPDPPSAPHTNPHVDDMSRLNATEVERVLEVRTIDDVKMGLRLAREHGRQVSVRGTQHSMGGHTIAPGGYVFDMRHFNTLTYDTTTGFVTVGAGVRWSDVILYLNQVGLSPRTMQSYSSFSVGGSISVNAHGITSDHCLAESVVSFHLVTADGEEHECSRESTDENAKILFSLAIGGYGLFGIITEVTLKVSENVHLELDLLRVTPKEFARVYKALLAADVDEGGDVDIKLARLDTTNLDHIELYVFRRASNTKTVSPLDLKPREMSLGSRIMYKWLAPTLQEVRFAVERTLGTAFDWSQTNERNALMYESAIPLARLYSPLIMIDDTFILQEYFVPQKSLLRWIEQAKPVYSKIANHPLVSLLNTTIRFVQQDKDTHLAYARDKDGVYAFVLYYRIRRTAEADEALKKFHEAFTEITLSVRGTFYLPYRHHYTSAQMESAYDRDTLVSFLQHKEKYDPTCLFSSLWLQKYGAAYASDRYRTLIAIAKPSQLALSPQVALASAGKKAPPFDVPVVSEQRTNSYRRLFHDSMLRRRFLEEFLVNVFNIEDPSTLFRLISVAVWDPENKTDLDIFCSIQSALTRENSGPLGLLSKTWKQLKQLNLQKDELTRETYSIISRLGKIGDLHDYVSIGDNGKLVLSLRKALEMQGQVWVVHDTQPDSSDVLVVLERGSVEPLGKYVPIDYTDVVTPKWNIPNESADLVTMNQGLHHLPQGELMRFLAEVYRILRPGGLFIVREHNATSVQPIKKSDVPTNEADLIPLLDIAHSVFNAVTGVPFTEERCEIRAFRSVLGWREIIEAAGFADTLLYEVQPNDPTVDEMMCFYKPPFTRVHAPRKNLPKPADVQLPAPPPLVPVLANLLQEVPTTLLDVLRSLLEGLVTNLPTLGGVVGEYVTAITSPGTSHVVKQMIDRFMSDVMVWLERFRPFIESSVSGGGNDSLSLLPPELFLIIPALNKKVALGTASPMEMVAAAFVHDLQSIFALDTGKEKEKKDTAAPTKPLENFGFTPQDVLKKLQALQIALPQLFSARILDDLEVPDLAKSTLRSIWAASALAKKYEESKKSTPSSPRGGLNNNTYDDAFLLTFAEWMYQYLDLHSWKKLSVALDNIIKSNAAHTPPPLDVIITYASSEDTIRGTDSAALWGKALMAVLGSPKISFNRTMVLQLKMIRISGLYGAWKFAQKHSNAERNKDGDDDGSNSLLTALKPFTQPNTNYIVMEEGHFKDVHNVAEVIDADFGYTSLTTSPVDVTEIIRQQLKGNTLQLQSFHKSKLQEQRESLPGWDRLRKKVTLNVSELRIKYRPILETDPTYQNKVDMLLQQLCDAGFIKPLHEKDGHFTWYKLPEWMQVEMVQIFGASMTHTPWYRFPFMPFISLYFKILLKEVSIVRSEHGFAKALFSNAFLTDLVPGVLMFFVFTQLQLLALPVKSVSGSEYTPELMVEQVVLLAPTTSSELNWNKIDDRITSQKVVDDLGLYVLTVPTFKPFTEILLKIAKQLPFGQVLEISNQRVVQVKVVLPASRGGIIPPATESESETVLLAKLGAISGCTVMFNYRYPMDGTTAEHPCLCVSVRVSTLSLIRFINTCAGLNVTVEQVYDFYA